MVAVPARVRLGRRRLVGGARRAAAASTTDGNTVRGDAGRDRRQRQHRGDRRRHADRDGRRLRPRRRRRAATRSWSSGRTRRRTCARSSRRLLARRPGLLRGTAMATVVNPRVFREYDIRGVAERDLDDATGRGARPRDGGADRRRHRRAAAAIVGRPRLPRDLAAPVRGAHRRHRACAPTSSTSAWCRRRCCTSRRTHLAADGGGDDHRQPQPARGQRLQDHGRHARRSTARRSRQLRDRGRPRLARRADAPHPAKRDALARRDRRRIIDARATRRCSSAQRRFKVVVDAGNGAGGPTAVGAVSPARLRRRAAVLRARRPLPEPSPRSDAAREPRRPDRGGEARERRARHRARRRRRSDRRRRRAPAASCGAIS